MEGTTVDFLFHAAPSRNALGLGYNFINPKIL